ncbi:hypothetical protein DIPPA_05917 [Diplonema papillatum]|nr:hypothetical protein DIPPA_05917 [Diplonema papillatum]
MNPPDESTEACLAYDDLFSAITEMVAMGPDAGRGIHTASLELPTKRTPAEFVVGMCETGDGLLGLRLDLSQHVDCFAQVKAVWYNQQQSEGVFKCGGSNWRVAMPFHSEGAPQATHGRARFGRFTFSSAVPSIVSPECVLLNRPQWIALAYPILLQRRGVLRLGCRAEPEDQLSWSKTRIRGGLTYEGRGKELGWLYSNARVQSVTAGLSTENGKQVGAVVNFQPCSVAALFSNEPRSLSFAVGFPLPRSPPASTLVFKAGHQHGFTCGVHASRITSSTSYSVSMDWANSRTFPIFGFQVSVA